MNLIGLNDSLVQISETLSSQEYNLDIAKKSIRLEIEKNKQIKKDAIKSIWLKASFNTQNPVDISHYIDDLFNSDLISFIDVIKKQYKIITLKYSDKEKEETLILKNLLERELENLYSKKAKKKNLVQSLDNTINDNKNIVQLADSLIKKHKLTPDDFNGNNTCFFDKIFLSKRKKEIKRILHTFKMKSVNDPIEVTIHQNDLIVKIFTARSELLTLNEQYKEILRKLKPVNIKILDFENFNTTHENMSIEKYVLIHLEKHFYHYNFSKEQIDNAISKEECAITLALCNAKMIFLNIIKNSINSDQKEIKLPLDKIHKQISIFGFFINSERTTETKQQEQINDIDECLVLKLISDIKVITERSNLKTEWIMNNKEEIANLSMNFLHTIEYKNGINMDSIIRTMISDLLFNHRKDQTNADLIFQDFHSSMNEESRVQRNITSTTQNVERIKKTIDNISNHFNYMKPKGYLEDV